MQVLRKPEVFRRLIEKERLAGRSIGFVPTMGALHEGHLSLVRAARKENDRVAVSIFVNPLQFSPKEDFKKYPRVFAEDRRLLTREKADFLFCPEPSAMYGRDFQTVIHLKAAPGRPAITEILCGKFRPGHFDGVGTVVVKLFNLAKPHRVYFGAKDYQQAFIVRRILADLNYDIRMRILPTVREPDGLALSSRNRYLSPADRRRALALPRTLLWLRDRLRDGKARPGKLRDLALRRLRRDVDRVDYLEIADPGTLRPFAKAGRRPAVILAACWVGKTRLIDNVIIRPFKHKA